MRVPPPPAALPPAPPPLRLAAKLVDVTLGKRWWRMPVGDQLNAVGQIMAARIA